MKKFWNIIFTLMIFSFFAVIACDGGGDGDGDGDGGKEPSPVFDAVDTSYAKTIADGTAVDISGMTGTKIYSIFSYMSGNKYEGNYTDPPYSYWTLSVSGGISTYEINNRIIDKIHEKSNRYTKEKTSFDLKMREKENELLASERPLVSKISKSILASAPASIAKGTSWTGVKVYDENEDLQTINTTCRYISKYAYFFVDDSVSSSVVTDAELAVYGTAFDSIYSVNHAKFGSENDVDSNSKLIVVFSDELTGGLLGYFNPTDKFSSSTYSDSNEGDIFYITADDYSNETICGTLAHEFQHMIYFDEHYNRGVTNTYIWLNEALSQAAEYYNEYLENHEAWIESFLGTFEYEGSYYPGWYALSLTYWTQDNYGYGAIFIRYLIDMYGEDAVKNMCSTDKVGVSAVESATGEDFNTIFYNFMIALAVSGTGDTSESKYNFSSLNLQAIQTTGRTGLRQATAVILDTNSFNYPYEIYFVKHNSTYGAVSLSGSAIAGAVLSLSQ